MVGGIVGPARAGWPARRHSGTTVSRGTGRRTRDMAVAELVDDMHRLWQTHRDRARP
ncbi:hypothetical protein ACTMTI_42875 [Nonomuraea sp. H19]|uniref:hypothetical protein n=1 Tax=Nonomuraea sp. H19 TaxID=3452206 RepID=UPI003F8BF448